MQTDSASVAGAIAVAVVIDDEKNMARVMQWVLKDLGFEVRGYETAEAAMQDLPGLHPDLIICDVRLPGLEGPGFAAWIKAQPDLSSVPIILMSAYREPLGHTADAFVSKLYEIEEIGATITRLLPARGCAAPARDATDL